MDTSAKSNVKRSNVECTLFVVCTKREAVMRNNLSKLRSGLECSCTWGMVGMQIGGDVGNLGDSGGESWGECQYPTSTASGQPSS